MGQRASLAIVTEHETELYYSHWRANTLDRDLFWGPEHAAAFIRQQRSEDEGAEILDEVWAEGGAVVDETRRTLLWYGGEDILRDVPRRRVHLALMGRLWQGWTIEWAHEGIADIADALGISREVVLTREAGDEPLDPRWVFEPPDDPTWRNTVLSSERNGALQFWTTQHDLREVLSTGPPLLSSLADVRGAASLDWAEITEDFPTGGLHVDWDRRELSCWHANYQPAIESRTRARFPGWRVTWWHDRYDAHAEAARDRLALPVPDIDSLLADIRLTLLAEDRDHSDLIPSLLERLGESPEGVNPFALRDDPLTLGTEERRRLLDEAVAEVFGAGERG